MCLEKGLKVCCVEVRGTFGLWECNVEEEKGLDGVVERYPVIVQSNKVTLYVYIKQ